MKLIGADTLKEGFLSVPDLSRQIVDVFRVKLRALMASGEVAATAKIVMASAREGIHIVERPYEALAFRQRLKERGIVEEIHYPM
jgi:hypothetical protein